MALLTTRTLKSVLSKLYIFHIVDTSDTTDNAAGSSFRATLSSLMDLFELYKNSYASGITAFAGGGQASATALTKAKSRVDTVATTNDSVKALTALAGTEQEIHNNTSTDLQLYPQTGENFLGLAANLPITVVGGGIQKIFCYSVGVWTY